MKSIVPDYYKDFHCIAGECGHTCCRGWEVDIDDESYGRYLQEKRPFGDEIRRNMTTDPDGTHHFILREDERCPFLREDGLCEMILALGENSLCQICRDHPRFRNFWTGMTETGLGLACEEAARLILTRKEPMRLIAIELSDSAASEEEKGKEIPEGEAAAAGESHPVKVEAAAAGEDSPVKRDKTTDRTLSENSLSGDKGTRNETVRDEKRVCRFDFSAFPEDERELLELREELFEILEDRRYPVDSRVDEMLETCGIIQNPEYSYEGKAIDEIAGEQLAMYLLFRTLADALYDGRLLERVYFVADSYRKIRNEWAKLGYADPEVARRFSEEVEYDTDTWK